MPVTFTAWRSGGASPAGGWYESFCGAEKHAALSVKSYLRLDCRADNRKQNECCERAGFRRCGRARIWGFEVSLYEKRVGIVSAG